MQQQVVLFYVLILFNAVMCIPNENDIVSESEPNLRNTETFAISKSPLDKRSYRGLVLANRMKVVIVSDPNTTKSACSLAVAVGGMSDPPELLGAAHFLEHLIFLGNAKHTEENGFQKFVSEHGGTSNAVSLPDKTYYFFRVAPTPTVFKEGLERFAQLFISPLLLNSSVENEARIVNSEHLKHVPDDRRRLERIESITAKPGHPFTQFRTGSLQTLWENPNAQGINIRDALLNFHSTYYSSNIMTLALVGRDDLDSLQEMVEEIFLEIPDRNASMPEWDCPLGPDELGERVDVLPLGEGQQVSLTFPVFYNPEYYKTSPLGYAAHLLGQEGPGSLAAVLKEKHFAESVIAGGALPARGFTFFRVRIALSLPGFDNLDKVIGLVFEYVALIRKHGPQEWFWKEIRDLGIIDFRFRDDLYPLELVNKLAVHLILYPMSQVLLATGVPDNPIYDPSKINETLNRLTPENCRIIVSSRHRFENDTENVHIEEEPIYGAKFIREKINSSLLNAWSNPVDEDNDANGTPFSFPVPNPFIPTSPFTPKPIDNDSLADPLVPKTIWSSEITTANYLQDTFYHLPKAVITVDIKSPVVYLDPLHANLMYIWSLLITESLGKFQYSANLAGLDSEVVATENGLEITVRGFSEKAKPFLLRILERVVSPEILESSERFINMKEYTSRNLRNRKEEEPLEHAEQISRMVLREKKWSTEDLIEAMVEVTPDRLKLFVKEFFSRLKIDILLFGSLTAEESKEIAKDVESLIIKNNITETKPLFRGQLNPIREVKLEKGGNYIVQYNHSHESSCTVFLFQIGLDSTRSNVLVQLLARIVHQLIFDRLRTQEQLGYVVWSDVFGANRHFTSLSLRLGVQGSFTPSFVMGRITEFLLEVGQTLRNMTEKEFIRHRKSLQHVKAVSPKTMEDRVKILLRELRSERRNFHRQEIDITDLGSVTQSDLVTFFEEYVENPSTRSRLIITISKKEDDNETSGETMTNEEDEEIVEITEWKRKMHLFPSLNPYKSKQDT